MGFGWVVVKWSEQGSYWIPSEEIGLGHDDAWIKGVVIEGEGTRLEKELSVRCRGW